MRLFNRFIILLVFIMSLFVLAGCGDKGGSSENNSGGGNNGGGNNNGGNGGGGLTDIDFPADPFSLLGVYEVETYGSMASGSPETEVIDATSGSQLRVNFDMASFKIQMGIVLNDFDGIYLTRKVVIESVDLPTIAKIFTDLGAEVVDSRHLKFTMTSEEYPELVEKGIIVNGETLILNINKTKNLALGEGLGDDFEVQPDPSETVKVTGVELDKKEYTITHGESESFTLSATVSPEDAKNKTVTFSSSNESVATVDSKGKVTIVGYGSAAITATTQDGNFTSVCAITIKPAPVTGLEIAPDVKTLTLTVTEFYDITATITPNHAANKAVTFSSSKESVATVDAKGRVTAAGVAGVATITVTSVDNGDISKTSTVTVEEAPIIKVDVTGVTLSYNGQNSTIVNKGAQAFTLVTEVSPANATNKEVTYLSGDAEIATVDRNGVVTLGNKTGTTNISVTTSDGGKTSTFAVTVEIFATKISFLKGETGVANGGKMTVAALIEPADATIQTVKYSSSDTVFASVDENTGEVTGNALSTSSPVTINAEYTNSDGTKINSSYLLNVYTAVDFSNPKSLEGTYEMLRFTQKNSMNVNLEPGKGLEKMIGEVTVTVDEVTKTITMQSKIQMNASALTSGAGAVARKEQFQVTQYDNQNYADGMTNESSFGETGSQTKGVVTKEATPNDTIKITQNFKKKVIINVTVDVNVFAQKKSDVKKQLSDGYQYWCVGANMQPKDTGMKCPLVEPNPKLGVF